MIACRRAAHGRFVPRVRNANRPFAGACLLTHAGVGGRFGEAQEFIIELSAFRQLSVNGARYVHAGDSEDSDMKTLPNSKEANTTSAASRGVRWSAPVALAGSLAVLMMQAGCAGAGPVESKSGLLYQYVDPGAHPAILDSAREAAGRAPMNVTFDPDQADASDYRLNLSFGVRDKGLHDSEAIWTMTTIYLFTLYPSTCAHFELTLTGDLYSRDGVRLKSWALVEQDTAFLWLLQGDNCSGPTDELVEKAASKMLKQLYVRMVRERAISGNERAPVGVEPLVYVDAVNAQQLVHGILKTDAPFANYTTEVALAAAAERTVRIEYEFVSAEQGLGSIVGRGMSSMMTLGLVSVCKPNTMILNAEVLGADGTVLRTYRFSQKKRASMYDDCLPPTDTTHPDVAARLLRKLLVQIEKEALI